MSENSNNPIDLGDETSQAFADVVNVEARVSGTGYSFTVTLSSPDTGCEQYADWWEVLDTDGSLIYRRILAHSHVNEQPFARSGGPANIAAEQEVWVRAHMNNSGYGGKAYFGSFNDGFEENDFPENFGEGLASQAPLPSGCAF